MLNILMEEIIMGKMSDLHLELEELGLLIMVKFIKLGKLKS